MKRIKFILLILGLFCFLGLVSCNKTTNFNNQNYGRIKYYIAGLYIGVNEYDELNLDDPNPKVYFDFSSSKHFGMLNTKSGTLDAAVTFTDLAKTTKVEDDINKYFMTTRLKFVNSDVSKIKLYLIQVDKDNNIVVNEELSESINVSTTSSYDYVVEFTNNKVKYFLQMKLLFK